MAASTGVHSYTTTLSIDPAGGTTFAVVAEVIDINGPGIKVHVSKRTNLNSPSATEEKVPGLVDPGQLTLKLNFTKVQYNLFMTTMLRKAGMAIKITYPLVGAEVTASALVGVGFLAEIGQAFPDNDVITQDVTIEATGPWTFTQGA